MVYVQREHCGLLLSQVNQMCGLGIVIAVLDRSIIHDGCAIFSCCCFCCHHLLLAN